MIDTLHRNYNMQEGTTSFLARIGHGVGYAASLGVGLARAAADGFPDLFDQSTSILRRHTDEQPTPNIQTHLG